MEMVDLFGKTVKYKHCNRQDVNIHFALIMHQIPDMAPEEFKSRMYQCVETATAFATEDDTCFLYYFNTDKRTADGIAIHSGNMPLQMLALLAGIFHRIDHNTLGISFKLHPGKIMSEYKSLLSLTAMKRYDVTNKALMVRIDHIRNKLTKLYNKKGISI